jgi:hypothetical protein
VNITGYNTTEIAKNKAKEHILRGWSGTLNVG